MSEELSPNEAVRRAIDPDHLLAGEDPESLQPEEVARRISVYSELISFKESLFGHAEGVSSAMSDGARDEALVDTTIMQEQLRCYRVRLDFWRNRAKQTRVEKGAAAYSTTP